MVHGDRRVDLVVGLVVHAPPGLAGHGDDGDDERRLREPAAAVDARQLLLPALRRDDDQPERLPVGRRRRAAGRLQDLLQQLVRHRVGLVAAHAIAGGDGLEDVHGASLGARPMSTEA